MQLPQETRTIEGLEVTVTMFDVTRSAPLAAKLGKILAPALGALEFANIEAGMSPMAFMATIAPALQSAFEGLAASGDFNALATEILAGTYVVVGGKKIELGRPGAITMAFGSDLVAYTQTLWFAIETNFKRFTSAALAGFGVGQDATSPTAASA